MRSKIVNFSILRVNLRYSLGIRLDKLKELVGIPPKIRTGEYFPNTSIDRYCYINLTVPICSIPVALIREQSGRDVKLTIHLASRYEMLYNTSYVPLGHSASTTVFL
jgi:hypothetical protein